VSKPALPPPTVADVAIIDGASRVELLWRSIGLLSLSGGSTLIRYERLLQTVRLWPFRLEKWPDVMVRFLLQRELSMPISI